MGIPLAGISMISFNTWQESSTMAVSRLGISTEAASCPKTLVDHARANAGRSRPGKMAVGFMGTSRQGLSRA